MRSQELTTCLTGPHNDSMAFTVTSPDELAWISMGLDTYQRDILVLVQGSITDFQVVKT